MHALMKINTCQHMHPVIGWISILLYSLPQSCLFETLACVMLVSSLSYRLCHSYVLILLHGGFTALQDSYNPVIFETCRLVYVSDRTVHAVTDLYEYFRFVTCLLY